MEREFQSKTGPGPEADNDTTIVDQNSSCVACSKPDSFDDMVACDLCDSWWHQCCAGVTKSIKDRDWTCPRCLPVPSRANSIRSTSTVRKALLELKLQRLEEEKDLKRKQFEVEQKQFEIELDQKCLDEKYRLLEAAAVDDDIDSEGSRQEYHRRRQRTEDWVSSRTSNVSERLEGAVGGVDEGRTDAQPIEAEQIQQVNSVVRELNSKVANCQKEPDPLYANLKVILKACQIQNNASVSGTPYTGTVPKSTRMLAPPIAPRTFEQYERREENVFPDSTEYSMQNQCSYRKHPQVEPGYNAPVPQHIAPERDVMPSNLTPSPQAGLSGNRIQHSSIVLSTPSASQIAARQALSRDLPIFSGNPADWPVFIANYNYTTEACGFNCGENMIRLQRCLKGPAYEAVRSKLVIPSLVPAVIDALEMRFGRPELLIETFINNVKSTTPPRADRLETLIDFGEKVQTLCDHIIAAELTDHLANPQLMKDLVEKLPPDYRMKWAEFREPLAKVNLQTFREFMNRIVKNAYRVTGARSIVEEVKSVKRDRGKNPNRIYVHTETGGSDPGRLNTPAAKEQKPIECAVCKKLNHRARECKTFQALSVEDRWKRVKDFGLCFTCLFGHGRRPCKNTKRCDVNGCEKRHHPLLHSDQKPQKPPTTTVETLNAAMNHQTAGSTPSLFYRIVPVTVHQGERSIDTFAFVDEGSSVSMLNTDLADKLGLQGRKKPLCITWTSQVTRTEQNSRRVSFEISALGKPKRFRMSNVSTIESLDLPVQSLPISDLQKRYPHFRGVPVVGYQNAVPEILIGVDHLRLVVPLKVREGSKGEPTIVKTRLGWNVYGGQRNSMPFALNFHQCECNCDVNLEDSIKKYFAVEETGVKPTLYQGSEEDARAMSILKNTTIQVDGRYESGLLWKHDMVELPDSRPMALRRLECFERKLQRNPQLKANVEQQIDEYLKKGYAHRATEAELAAADPRKTWYLPLNVVTNPRKPGKYRLVWDAAATVKGVALNTMLLKGPDLLTSLPAVLFRFRQHTIGVSADIKEMYHQVRIRKADRDAQRFLWRRNPTDEPEVFIMDVATFGSASSPATAQYVKNTNALQFRDEAPRAVAEIVDGHYVDDFVSSFPTIQEAQQISAKVKEIHQKGGFELRNFCSNSPELLTYLNEQAETTTKVLGVDKNDDTERVLGMMWVTTNDTLQFSTTMSADIQKLVKENTKPTKREVLRCVMTLFDPLGILSPYLVHGKVLIQELWRSGVGWDEQISDCSFQRWLKWIDIVDRINDIKIPRYYFGNFETPGTIEIHTFVDASEVAYACVTYFRRINEDGTINVALVSAKTKVAPLKPMTIPRMELMACVIGTRQAQFVVNGHSFSFTRRLFWSDSNTALSWINSDPMKFQQFVRFRVGEILESTQRQEWRWVPTKLNPADEATKWGVGPYFSDSSIWFRGPEFLYQEEELWPTRKALSEPTEELRHCNMHAESIRLEDPIDVGRFSRWSKVLRVTAYMYRFSRNSRKNSVRNFDNLTQEELLLAENCLIRMIQRDTYPEDLKILKENSELPRQKWKALPKTSKLEQLSPVLDEFGILRVDSRIVAAKRVSKETKYPIILPGKHVLTELIIDSYHRKFLHRFDETTVNEIRQKYHIQKLRSLVKKISKRCGICKIRRAQPVVPRMAALPPARLSPFERPFSYVGVDYFGPIHVKVGRSQVKRWIAIFTCLTVRAVHVEIAYNLSTESCVMCVRRFIARRGFPIEIYSDNATNFQGAERLLFEQINNKLATTFTSTTTSWFFIPPGAPHMGGAWERMVRSVKTALYAACENELLDDEALYTFLVDAELIINSRPLTYMPLNSETEEALTPNHLILGSSNGVRQPTIPEECTHDLLKRAWTKVQKKLDQFWRRWVLEYLPTLTKRTKWFNETRDIAVGDVVLIVNEGKRNSWERGLIVELIAASDGRIRQAWVRTGNGVYRKPIAKLAILEVSSQDGGSRELPDCVGGSRVSNDEGVNEDSGSDETEASRRFHRGENVGKLATVPVRGCSKVAEK
ncbi:uncharacterized protein LOC129742764 [Uranotaenia lowii]|uniref:uncharacterized protein LOC129742764 n=1 Tax=Uranotaenia lowii TaxID=190385 RepID=UPI0024796D6C|nr:uncharacterized protein LOC129742764 [Uranotaenia lowii]